MPPSLSTAKAVWRWRRRKHDCGFESGTRSRIEIPSGASEVGDGGEYFKVVEETRGRKENDLRRR
ncbi:uncharacterized protein G2W53_025622 [Senna tora]|uniref:Uncharacterized protein n=1 Tax=Senna tora TaxID=362788 RepID=A0A834TDH9_9FABA|nr:uncharacterized protein G2W53_025622 [Senna tora]